MSRSSRRRAQTEPLAALVAVSVLVAGVGLYAAVLADVLPGSADRTVEETAIDRIRDDVDGDGTFRGYQHDDLGDLVDVGSLPAGRNVYVAVTVAADGRETVVADALFGPDGVPDRTPIDDGELDGPPPTAGVATRPLPVATSPGEVRGGTIRVGVWSP